MISGQVCKNMRNDATLHENMRLSLFLFGGFHYRLIA